MAERTSRLQIVQLSEVYRDMLLVDAALAGNPEATQARALLQAKLREEESSINKRVEYLAKKRGLSFDEMWKAIVTGKYTPLSPEEWAELEVLNDSKT